MRLKDYAAKRRFSRTPEPRPEHGTKGRELSFVVQKHAARALHYDLRLELGGVLKSWAVPKGPSLDPSVKRLAMMVEDHPFEYRDFEGVIPEGNYGAGSVVIWDRGLFRHPAAANREESERLLLQGLKKGEMKFVLAGEKLRGEFALVKTGKDERSWLLLKKKDSFASDGNILSDSRSVVSAKSLEDMYAGQATAAERLEYIRLREALEGATMKDVPAAPMPHGVKPMLAMLGKGAFDDPDWIFEIKWDGYRAISEVDNGKVRLYSRNGVSFGERFPTLLDRLKRFKFEAVMDGEIVVVDQQGRADFQKLQHYQRSSAGHLLYYVFDLIHLEGRNLMNLPLIKRKELLQRILPSGGQVKFSDHIRQDGVLFFQLTREKGIEGIMAKHSGSLYTPGARSKNWLKVKSRLTQEGVIAGFTAPRGGRKLLGALVLGFYSDGDLIYIGHTGGGFSEKMLKEVRTKLDPLISKTSPFREAPKTNTAVTWVKPELVCEVTFQGWTEDGLMRQPVFLRLRDDLMARDVTREWKEG
ncbi:MAG: non-homologous end-joining DNA ligase [Smithellaceae bacterium]|nr:non-homologous end-joining DNA ligase [Smithellaceae bacterium]